jgi:hypothetical protein
MDDDDDEEEEEEEEDDYELSPCFQCELSSYDLLLVFWNAFFGRLSSVYRPGTTHPLLTCHHTHIKAKEKYIY